MSDVGRPLADAGSACKQAAYGGRRLAVAVFAFIVYFSPAQAFASLRWDTQQIELTAQPGEKTATGVFRFVNSGTVPVTIASAKASCSCTEVELVRRTYAPNEAGEIKAVFGFGDRIGLQETAIFVATDDASAAPENLILRVHVPELLACSSHRLVWTTTEELTEKSVTVTATSPLKIVAIEAFPSSTPPQAVSRIETVEQGIECRIFLKPVSNAEETAMSQAFTVRFADNTTRTVYVFLVVEAKASQP